MPVEPPQIGLASWYRDSTNADDSPVRSGDMTAAHRHLPFGTMVKVTRTDTGTHTVVCITDRGPFVSGVIIDLRPTAAKALGFGPLVYDEEHDPGRVPVKLEVMGK